MQRKPGYPVANCSIKMPDGASTVAEAPPEDEGEQLQRRQQLINFGHTQWGFNNWNWSVIKQDLDFVDFSNGKYCAGVVAFVSITVKRLDIHRENIGYATSYANTKGSAIYMSRKCAVTNALRETLLSFGGAVANDLMDLMEVQKNISNAAAATTEPPPENQKPVEPKNAPLIKALMRDNVETPSVRPPNPLPSVVKNAIVNPTPPVAKTHPMPSNLPPAANRPPLANVPRPPLIPTPARPNSNVSFVLQPIMGPSIPPLYGPPRPHMPQMYPNFYEYSAGPWHFTYETFDRHHGNVNLNFNIPPKNVVVNSRSGAECKNACGVRPGPSGVEGEPIQYGPPPQNQGCWIKPTIFYDGFWTEQKVKKWVAEQVEKQFPEDPAQKPPSPSNGRPDSAPK